MIRLRYLLIYLSLISTAILHGQYTTPNQSVSWNMDSLVIHSGGVVIATDFGYQIMEDLTIAETDMVFTEGLTIRVSVDVRITAQGGYESYGTDYYGPNMEDWFEGFRLEETATVIFDGCSFTNCGGFKVITPNFIMNDCQMDHLSPLITTGAAIELSHGKPIITNSQISYCDMSAISSAANAEVAPIIVGNTFIGNVESNSNRPQINLGPSGADTTLIADNSITGENIMAGGIAISSLVGGAGHVIIRNNLINTNRYGIAIIGNDLHALIDDNLIEFNNIQNDPMLGGSGINFNGNESSDAIVSNNSIRGNLWGVTIQNNFQVNLGDNGIAPISLGGNIFNGNGNGGQLYELYNNTPSPVFAMHNCWSSENAMSLDDVENVIYHQNDDDSLGEVFFEPLGEGCFVSIEENDALALDIQLSPNPTQEGVFTSWDSNKDITSISVYNALGLCVNQIVNITADHLWYPMDRMDAGLYLFVFQTRQGTLVKKMVIKQ